MSTIEDKYAIRWKTESDRRSFNRKIFAWNVCIICLYTFGWMARHDEEKEKNIDNIYIYSAGIHQSNGERERRENNMTNEKIDVNKK
jgi:hypothetical protein